MNRRGRILVLIVAAIAAAAVAATVWADTSTTTISTFGAWNGSSSISAFGKPNTATYGQTVVVPAGAFALTSFTFELAVPTSVIFRGEVYAWNGVSATGSALWESAPVSTSAGTFQAIRFTPNVRVSPGTKLVLFASVSRDFAASGNATGSWGATGSGTYSGGTFVYLNNGNDPSQWTSTPWSSINEDLAFSATFSSTLAGASARGGYCSVAGNTNLDGSPIPPGTFLNLDIGQASSDAHYKGAVPASYFQGIGISCDNPPAGYVDSGTKVNSGGVVASDGLYEYWVKS